MKIILASGSPRRKEILELAGAEFEIIPAKGEEIITKKNPEEVVEELSTQKAREIEDRINKGEEARLIIGADTIVACENKILGKPKSREMAKEMLMLLQGRSHSVFTGVCCIYQNGTDRQELVFAEETEVSVYEMNERQIEAYIRTGEPMDKAGSYAVQGKFAVNIKGLKGDYYNVMGFPIARICHELRQVGIDILADS